MKKAFLFLAEYAKQNNISFEDAARRYLQSNGVYQSAVKDYILRAGRIPNVGIIEQAKQAGTLILISSEDKLEEFLNLEPGQIPTLYRKLNFYGFANEFPVVFIACLVLAGDDVLNTQSSSNFRNWEPKKDLQKAAKAARQLGNWIDEKVDQAKDLAGDAAKLAKKIALAPARGPFLLLVRLNVFNLARRIVRAIEKDRQRMKNFWEDEIGGDFVQLINTAEKGKKEMPILPGKSQTFTGKYSSAEPVSTAAAAVLATPITVQIGALLTAIGVLVDQGLEIKDKIEGKKKEEEEQKKEEQKKEEQKKEEQKKETTGQQVESKNNTTMLLLVGAGLVAAYLVFKKKI